MVDIKEFLELMEQNIKKHQPIYGDTWKEMSPGHLEARLKQKLAEYELTINPDKLISVANLAMLLYLRMKNKEQGDK